MLATRGTLFYHFYLPTSKSWLNQPLDGPLTFHPSTIMALLTSWAPLLLCPLSSGRGKVSSNWDWAITSCRGSAQGQGLRVEELASTILPGTSGSLSTRHSSSPAASNAQRHQYLSGQVEALPKPKPCSRG